MRDELTDREWAAIKPMLPNKLPDGFGPYTTFYNRFVRWRRAAVWHRIMNTLARAHDSAVLMIDTSIVRVQQHGACITRNKRQSMGRSRGGLTSKIHALVDTNTCRYRLALLPVRRTTIDLQIDCCLAGGSGRCCWQTAVMMRTGSEHLPRERVRWPMFRLDAIASNQSLQPISVLSGALPDRRSLHRRGQQVWEPTRGARATIRQCPDAVNLPAAPRSPA
jgi:transposase